MILLFAIEGYFKMLLPAILQVVLLIAVIPITEGHLKKKFDEEGNPRTNAENQKMT